MKETYQVEVGTDGNGHSLVVVTDSDSGRRLCGTTPDHLASQMVGVLIEDHRERRDADSVDSSLVGAKAARREACFAAAVTALGDVTAARQWLTAPNKLFGNRRPLAVAAASEDGFAAVKNELTAQATTNQ